MRHRDFQNTRVAQVDLPLFDGTSGDACGHGTGVASLLVASHNAYGMAGAAPTIELLPIRVLHGPGCTGTAVDLAFGITLAAQHGAKIISLSVGLADPAEPTPLYLSEAIRYATEHGSIVVAAAGNTGFVHAPANDPNVISVGCVDHTGRRCHFSAPGANVAIMAGGQSIPVATPGGAYSTASGTSLAAPLISAGVAMAAECVPSLTTVAARSFLRITANQTSEGHELSAASLTALLCSDYS